MDVFFHAGAGALLASALGERRWSRLALACLIGIAPDIPLGISRVIHSMPPAYGITHSPVYCLIALAILLGLNWRIALALPLHILVDAPLHKYSGLYGLLGVGGINWYEGCGMIIWAVLWTTLVVLAVIHMIALRRAKAATASAGP
ncbi:MAG: hypothetical protein ACE15C_01885 [Phycisphaerae bacterium]